MGGIKLDWHVESEQSQTRATEDPAARQRRLHAWRQFLAILAALAIVVGAVVAAILWRLNDIENRIHRDLLDTVDAEITALRIGDLAGFMAIQRSASDAFMLEQSRKYEEYQALKQAGRIQLTGTVIDATIDNQRARVVIEEILDGVPQHVVWFYWRYEDGDDSRSGWRRVPDDLTFWGDSNEIAAGAGSVTYHALDEPLARALAERLPAWWGRGCALLSCADVPPVPHIDIVAARPAAVEWASPDGWTLRVTSPLVGRARADVPLPPDLARSIAQQLAARLVRYSTGSTALSAHNDAAWLYDEYARWMAHHMMSQTPSPEQGGFIESLIAAYGPGAPGTVLSALRSTPTLDGVLTALTGIPLAQLSADQLDDLAWGSFFQWRLALEPRLLSESHGEAFIGLYDLGDRTAAGEAMLRLESPAYALRPVPVVRSVQITRENQQTYAWVGASYMENGYSVQDVTILWRWANESWRRVN